MLQLIKQPERKHPPTYFLVSVDPAVGNVHAVFPAAVAPLPFVWSPPLSDVAAPLSDVAPHSSVAAPPECVAGTQPHYASLPPADAVAGPPTDASVFPAEVFLAPRACAVPLAASEADDSGYPCPTAVWLFDMLHEGHLTKYLTLIIALTQHTLEFTISIIIALLFFFSNCRNIFWNKLCNGHPNNESITK